MTLTTDQANQYPLIWRWMNRHTKLPWSTDLRTLANMRDDGTIAAAVAYNNWTDSMCFMHVAFENPHCLTRSFLRAAFAYPFQDVGLDAVYVVTQKQLKELNQFTDKLGFKKIAETVDAFIREMRQEDCRWLKLQEKEHGQQRFSASYA